MIGGDAAALATALAAAAFGVSVVLVENGDIGAQRDGGALSSKALLAAAAHVNAMRTGAHFGVKTVRFGVDFNAVRAHVQDTLDAIAPLQSRERLKGLGVRVVTGAARVYRSQDTRGCGPSHQSVVLCHRNRLGTSAPGDYRARRYALFHL